MVSIYLKDILPDENDVNSFVTFRNIEDWCISNLSKERWRFDYSTRINAYGVDVPARILFTSSVDATMFTLTFCSYKLK